MTTEGQFQSIGIYQINGIEDDGSAAVHRLHFFRSKNKQRVSGKQTSIIGDSPNESFDFFKTPKQTERIQTRSSSPPVTDEQEVSPSSEVDNSSIQIEDFSKKLSDKKHTFAQSRLSLPAIYSGYERKKSHSAKLTSINQHDSSIKKAVRFADDFGLELNQIRMIKTDELPSVPSTAFNDLHITKDHNSSHHERIKVINYMKQQFENPMYIPGFNDRVSRHKVVLEQANAIDNRIYGTIRLVSLSLHKRVKIRLTTDNWITYRDYDAAYITNSHDGIHDRFSFTLEIDRNIMYNGNNIQFCVCYESNGGPEYWDNNLHQNYRFNSFSSTIPDYSN